MGKSKNHTNHNHNRKAHGNDIKRLVRNRHESTLGMDQNFLTNQKLSRKSNLPTVEAKKRFQERLTARVGKSKPVTL